MLGEDKTMFCKKCSSHLPEDAFYPSKRKQHKCKSCWGIYRKSNREKNIERWREYARIKAIEYREKRKQTNPRKAKTYPEKFVERFVVTPGCWIWKRSKTADGYGQFCMNGGTVRAHRYSYLIYKGEIPDGMSVCHKCDNPSCVNPDHLWLGTQFDNMRDMAAKKRNSAKIVYSKLEASDIIAIRADDRKNKIIADEYGVERQTILRIKKYRSWKNI